MTAIDNIREELRYLSPEVEDQKFIDLPEHITEMLEQIKEDGHLSEDEWVEVQEHVMMIRKPLYAIIRIMRILDSNIKKMFMGESIKEQFQDQILKIRAHATRGMDIIKKISHSSFDKGSKQHLEIVVDEVRSVKELLDDFYSELSRAVA